MEKKIKVLQVVPSLSQANGVVACILNYCEHIDKNKYQVDFAVLSDWNKSRFEEIKNSGYIIHELYRCKNIFKYIFEVKKFFRENAYDIIHCNVANTGVIFLYYAKKYNVRLRILHSHATQTSDKLLNKLRNDGILLITKKFANCYVACSNLAGKAMFKNNNFIVLNNAIDCEKYRFDLGIRNNIRQKYNLKSSEFIIGTIGRLCEQKNQIFLIKLLSRLDNKFKLIIVGNGRLEKKLKKEASDLGVSDRVIFTGSIKNTNEYYSAFDLFVLPSLYEGLPVVGVEAQANGVPCVFSETITNELQINTNVLFEKLDLNIWEHIIKNCPLRNENCYKFLESNYNIKNEAHSLENIYDKQINIQ